MLLPDASVENGQRSVLPVTLGKRESSRDKAPLAHPLSPLLATNQCVILLTHPDVQRQFTALLQISSGLLWTKAGFRNQIQVGLFFFNELNLVNA